MSDKNPEQTNELEALFTLATEHKMAVEVLIGLIGIPEELASRGLSAAVFINILRLDENAKSMIDELKCRRDFDELCSAFPNVSVECFRLLGMASVSIDMFFRGPQSENNVRDKVLHLMNSSMSLGGATALLPVSIGYLSAKVQAERKAMLSAAGMAGADIKHAATRELEKWAIEQAGKLQGSHKKIANTLAQTLPEHLKNTSNDPVRFIYDKLRLSKKCNELIRLASHT